ncbi:MAG: wax ester/triacylglycerol synthase family O-acyltransferase [Deltaproteobacteria bacterium]|nr:wax ester/triacylglycerol synthase family O-acyltransferase [Deltaproteobacteria bacterium]
MDVPGLCMGYSHYDRLSAVDSMFLDFEESRVHMHVGAVALFESGPLTNDAGELDFERIRATIDAALIESPRFRQRLRRIPLFDHPVWVDDDSFNLRYHLRHTSLPRPGGQRQLKRQMGRIMSQKLDRSRPLWEMWVIEGVEESRFAVIFKVHHCMVDGVSGLDLLARSMRPDRESSVERPQGWIPRPPPSDARLFRDELVHRSSWPLSLAGVANRALRGGPRELVSQASESLLAVGEFLSAGLSPTAATPLNPEIGPHRRFDWVQIDMEAVKEVRERLGGTLNDVVLATAAGAIGRFLRLRGISPRDMVFRAQVPVSIRSEAERGREGNRVIMLLAELPIDEEDPSQRLERVVRTTERLKASRQRAGVELFEELSDRALSSLFLRVAQLAVQQRSFNVVITNIPGPQVPVYLLGARMLEIYPLVPLAINQALGIALFSYVGKLFWGFNADWDALPDLHELVTGVAEEFEGLHKLVSGRAS